MNDEYSDDDVESDYEDDIPDGEVSHGLLLLSQYQHQ
jgi:hypothetical protein